MGSKRGGQHKTSKATDLPTLPRALCRAEDPKLWISDDTELYDGGAHFDPEPAKRICRRCPEKDPCLRFALANPALTGIWGGTTPKERQSIRLEGEISNG